MMGSFDMPAVRPGAAAGQVANPGLEADQRACGLPSGLLPDWRRVFLDAFARVLERFRSLRLAMDACTRCGACARACPFFLGSGDPQNIPAARMELAREVYRRFLASPLGWARRRRAEKYLDESVLRRWYTYFNQCSLCRRCALFCPLGIDVAEATAACREVLAAVGLTTASAAYGAAASYRQGNSQGLAPETWTRIHLETEDRLKRETGRDIKCPADEYGAEVLLIPPAADLTGGRKSFMGYAKVFHAAGVSWTTSTYASDAAVFGAYLDYRNMRLLHRRVLEAAWELRPRYVVWGENGHGWRVARNFGDTVCDLWRRADYLETRAPIHILEWTHHQWLRGAFDGKLDKEANQDKVVTFHDSCHPARSCGLLEEPRALIRACCHNFHELPPQVSGRFTLCCGGGGGLTGDEQRPLRLAGFLPRARSLARIQQERGCNFAAMICDGCKAAISEGVRHYGLAYAVGGVHELLGAALYASAPSEAEGPA